MDKIKFDKKYHYFKKHNYLKLKILKCFFEIKNEILFCLKTQINSKYRIELEAIPLMITYTFSKIKYIKYHNKFFFLFSFCITL